jgi:3-hydroxyisobutyrate dehydrogenase-like beta-hydroxyacid dehydrogenase
MAATTTTRIGFVGLGHMGGNMAARFLAAGYPVYGEERNRAAAQGLEHDGLQWRDTPREAADAADVLFTSLPDDRVLEAVATGSDGILAGLAADKVWVDMSGATYANGAIALHTAPTKLKGRTDAAHPPTSAAVTSLLATASDRDRRPARLDAPRPS